MLSNWLAAWLMSVSFLSDKMRIVLAECIAILGLVLLTYLVARILKWIAHFFLGWSFIHNRWPRLTEALRASYVLDALGFTLSAVIAFHSYPFFMPLEGAVLHGIIGRIVGIYGIICVMGLLVSSVNVVDYLYGKNPKVPLRGVFQAAKIIIVLLAVLVIISVVTSKRPMYVITGLSAAAAVFMLIFKDPILGFAAGIQLASNKLLKIGDWITMPSHGADGTVVDITLTTVRVQNFDNTIVNLPAYDLVSRPFQNWNGMLQSGARRIQRALYIDVEAIQFLDQAMLERLSKIKLLETYLKNKVTEIRAFNEQRNVKESVLNGRHLTNIGTFRQYAVEYLRSLPTIDHTQTCMVRQLAAGSQGLPLEIYCFAATTEWVKYEGIQSDIFDHLYSVMPEFGLYPFQQPTGRSVSKAFGKEVTGK